MRQSYLLFTLSFVFLTACQGFHGSSSSDNGEQSTPVPVKCSDTIVADWMQPTKDKNGFPLAQSDIGGYKIFIRNAPNTYSQTIDIAHNNTLIYQFSALPVGSYYLAVLAYNTSKQDGAKTKEVGIQLVTCAPKFDNDGNLIPLEQVKVSAKFK